MIITTAKAMRPRDEHDFYPTPSAFVKAALALIDFEPKSILDPGAGTGVWGIEARRRWPNALITGVELRDVAAPPAYDLWLKSDFRLQSETAFNYDLIIGNPPYKHAESFVRTSLDMCAVGGRVLFLLRLAFLESRGRAKGLWRKYPPQTLHVCARRPSFTGNNKTNATAFAIFDWQKGCIETPRLSWLDFGD